MPGAREGGRDTSPGVRQRRRTQDDDARRIVRDTEKNRWQRRPAEAGRYRFRNRFRNRFKNRFRNRFRSKFRSKFNNARLKSTRPPQNQSQRRNHNQSQSQIQSRNPSQHQRVMPSAARFGGSPLIYARRKTIS